MSQIGIIGAGCQGRTLALMLLKNKPDSHIMLVDQDESLHSKISCGYAAAGMVAPLCEAAFVGEHQLYTHGVVSLQQWPRLLSQLPSPDKIYHQNGTLVLAHPRDHTELTYFDRQIKRSTSPKANIHYLNTQQLTTVEPGLTFSRFYSRTIYLPEESCLNIPEFYRQTADYLHDHQRASYHQATIAHIHPHNHLLSCSDWIVDCRGLGARADHPQLRGLRGEAIVVEAPTVSIKHTIRLMHPRYPLYIVPRGNHQYYIGATTIESEDTSAVSVQSTMELLSALYIADEGFAEGRILKLIQHNRPALPSGLPEIKSKNNVIYLNGLNRHGYLLAPYLSQQALNILENKKEGTAHEHTA